MNIPILDKVNTQRRNILNEFMKNELRNYNPQKLIRKGTFFLVQREDLYLHKLLKQIQFYKKHSGVKMYHN